MEAVSFAVCGNICGLFGREKQLKTSGGGRRWCQVLDAVFEASGDV